MVDHRFVVVIDVERMSTSGSRCVPSELTVSNPEGASHTHRLAKEALRSLSLLRASPAPPEPRGTGNSSGMAAKTSRLNLARIELDILLLIAEYLCVQDMVSLSQTCTRLRNSVSNNKSALINTLNFYIIALPSHDSLATLSSDDLFARAIRATALSRRLSSSIHGPMAAPFNKREIHFRSPQSSHQDQGPIQSIRYNERHVIVVCGRALYLVDLSTSAAVERPYDSFIQTSFHDCESSEEILIALRRSIDSPNTLPDRAAEITIERCSLKTDTFGTFQNQITLALELTSYGDVQFQGDLIAFIYKAEIVLCNWKKYTALVFPIPNSHRLNMLQLNLHPHKATVIVDYTTSSIGGHKPGPWLLSVEAPTNMPSMTPADDSGKLFVLDHVARVHLGDPIFSASGITRYEAHAPNNRETIKVHLKMLFDPANDDREYSLTVRPHERDSMMDIVRHPDVPFLAETDNRFEHLRISLADWSTYSVPVISRVWPRRDYLPNSPKSFSLVLNESPYVSTDYPVRELYALRLATEYHLDSGFVRLKLPDFCKWGLPHMDDTGVLKNTLIGFDMLRGWLFFWDNDHVHIFEY
ncbi:hypothetical protein SISSUDRAFT_1131317 [Sistotremastrum suecicum HHB10207 ss-3]|uniref:F-box domain-containing protein n=1 Tax=Sistotremastrum suecicum HHB10207 ss-3 TaxID=1314776 RepID=A0A166AB48_9AGAM|nr:hypothetical protein SISSUDRAFT_1131317 [Sistotremastrum suecicum HHB10207 ss-3]